ncbi:sensor histidine kinase [Paramicrobacterium agarici]|uniref:Signal transduction histidine kinase n=1 Tax=Paramicrobacterium agarici TaxID=630514 RepID=A0A2A9DUN9_9MICO|nr:histidine kinase [Microbacterium agarici]PFG30294.1 signal transduction histidine kinase [Microbacterium agarici]
MAEHTQKTRVVATAWRRALVLLIGGLVALPYGAIAVWSLGLWITGGPLSARLSSLVVLALLVVPAVLPVTRALERTVANQLLDTAIPEPQRRATLADTGRGALFFAGHIASGGILILGIAFVFPLCAVLIGDALTSTGSDEGAALLRDTFSITEIDATTALIVGGLAAVLIVVVTIAAAYLLPWYATLLLGPSRDEQRASEAEAARAGQRREALARDVHDSVGHALTVSTMQALVARGAIERDPDAARAALDQIERVSRAAVAELDYVLRVLRDGDEPRDDRAPDRRTLADVDSLARETRAVGFEVDLCVDGHPEKLPASLGREAYRVVQEGVTNALRYAATPRVTVSIVIDDEELSVLVENETSAVRVIDGRGLAGVRERVAVLGGESSVDIVAERWRLSARLPVRGPQGGRGT